MKGNTLEERVTSELDDESILPSAVKSNLAYCSSKLAKVTTEEEFDEIMTQYSLLDNQLRRVGFSVTNFEKIITNMKKEL